MDSLFSVCSEDVVKSCEGILGEDNESSEVTTWSELEEVKSVNVAGINTGKVTGGSLEVGVFVTIDNKGSLGELETRVSQFVETSTG